MTLLHQFATHLSSVTRIIWLLATWTSITMWLIVRIAKRPSFHRVLFWKLSSFYLNRNHLPRVLPMFYSKLIVFGIEHSLKREKILKTTEPAYWHVPQFIRSKLYFDCNSTVLNHFFSCHLAKKLEENKNIIVYFLMSIFNVINGNLALKTNQFD